MAGRCGLADYTEGRKLADHQSLAQGGVARPRVRRHREEAPGRPVTQREGVERRAQHPATKRAALYAEIQKIYSDAAPIASIAYLGATAGWRSNIDGFFIDGLSYYRFEDVKINK